MLDLVMCTLFSRMGKDRYIVMTEILIKHDGRYVNEQFKTIFMPTDKHGGMNGCESH